MNRQLDHRIAFSQANQFHNNGISIAEVFERKSARLLFWNLTRFFVSHFKIEQRSWNNDIWMILLELFRTWLRGSLLVIGWWMKNDIFCLTMDGVGCSEKMRNRSRVGTWTNPCGMLALTWLFCEYWEFAKREVEISATC